MNNHITKKEFIEIFKLDNDKFIRKCRTMPTDFPALRQAWNDTFDSWQKSGLISSKANWTQPQFIANPTVLK